MSSISSKQEIINLLKANKQYLRSIGLGSRHINHLHKLGIGTKTLLSIIKKNIAKSDAKLNQFNEVSNEIIEEYENLNNPINEEEIMTQL